MVPALGLCLQTFHNPQVMEELCLRGMGTLLKGVLANFRSGCPKWNPSSSREGCASQENWERSLASKAGWLQPCKQPQPIHSLGKCLPVC